MEDLDELLGGFDVVSLKAFDERAALLRRVDNKYLLGRDAFVELAQELRTDHEVLEIDGGRVFGYSTTYFETPDLRSSSITSRTACRDSRTRTRLYEDSGDCVFEVKLNGSGGETDKRQIDYAPDDRLRVTDEAFECVKSALADAGLQAPAVLEESLTSLFDRVTLAARSGSERLTCDLGIRLIGPAGDTAALRSGLVLLETKCETGESPADRELARMQISPISLSKYRVGMSLVGAAKRFGAQPGSDFFDLSQS